MGRPIRATNTILEEGPEPTCMGRVDDVDLVPVDLPRDAEGLSSDHKIALLEFPSQLRCGYWLTERSGEGL